MKTSFKLTHALSKKDKSGLFNNSIQMPALTVTLSGSAEDFDMVIIVVLLPTTDPLEIQFVGGKKKKKKVYNLWNHH